MRRANRGEVGSRLQGVGSGAHGVESERAVQRPGRGFDCTIISIVTAESPPPCRLQETEKQLSASEVDRQRLLQQVRQVPGSESKRAKPPRHPEAGSHGSGVHHGSDGDPASSSSPKSLHGKGSSGSLLAEKRPSATWKQPHHSNGGSLTARSAVSSIQDTDVHGYVPLTAVVRVPRRDWEGGTGDHIIHFPHELDDSDYIRL